MTTAQWISLLVVALAHTGAMFYWGGSIWANLKAQGSDIRSLKQTVNVKHADWLNRHEAEIYLLKNKVEDVKEVVVEVKNGGVRPA